MLTEERHQKIISIVKSMKSVSVQQLMDELDASESTIRRDLSFLDKEGYVVRVRGGAVSNDNVLTTSDDEVNIRMSLNMEDKRRIAQYAASLIEEGDFVYLDAGTTIAFMLEYITERNVSFVTNAINHARTLTRRGYTVYLIGGEYKEATEAIIGEEAVISLSKYNFTKGFFGTNGVNTINGFTTPDVKEALIKKKAMECCKKRYVLCDSSKFSMISSVTFAEFNNARIITTSIKNGIYSHYKNITEVE